MIKDTRTPPVKLLEDEYPTHYLPHVGRQVMESGGAPKQLPPIDVGAIAPQYKEPPKPVVSDMMQNQIAEIGDREIAKGLAKYGRGPLVSSNVGMPLKAGPEQSFWEKARDKMLGLDYGRPSVERRQAVEGIGSAIEAAKLAAYAYPATRAPMGVFDFTKSVAEGRPIEASLASAFLPGGKYAKYAGAALASQAGPEEAKATFIGEAARLTPSLRRALELSRKYLNVDRPQDVWRQYDWAPDPSGRMVSELSDEGARLIPQGLARFRTGETMSLGDILSHPEVYDRYPSSYTTKVTPYLPKEEGERGYYSPLLDYIGINERLGDRQLMKTLLHEHQHRIQNIEGMSPGARTEMFKGPEAVARPHEERLSQLLGAMKLQEIMRENPGIDPLDAKVIAGARGIPIVGGSTHHTHKGAEELAQEAEFLRRGIDDIYATHPTAHEQYLRTLGEWSARLPGERLELTMPERRVRFPFDPNYPVNVLPVTSRPLGNLPGPRWEAERERAIELARQLRREPLPAEPRPSLSPEQEALEEDMMQFALEAEARKRAGVPPPAFGPALLPTIKKAGGGPIAKLLGKLLPEGSGYVPRKGFPGVVNLPGIGRVEPRPIEPIESISRRFAGPAHDAPVVPINPEFSERVAREYEGMRHAPKDPVVRRAFEALADETMAQYRAAKDLGLDIRFLKPGQADPYAASPGLGYEDIVNRGRLFVFPTEQGFGSTGGLNATNVLLKGAGQVGDKPDAVVNDAFRVIHDLYGHFGPGNPFFRAPGEERAYQLHKRMFSPEAVPALASETRGQNSWVNFGPMAERNRAASGAETHYADQKTGVMAPWATEEPPPVGADIEQFILNKRESGGRAKYEGGGKAALIGAALKAAEEFIPYTKRMFFTHNIDPLNLKRAIETGGLPAPSMAVSTPTTSDLSDFGPIALVGKPEKFSPTAKSPVYGQDIWSPRVPNTREYERTMFSPSDPNAFEGRGFFSMLHDRPMPGTMENLLAEMNARPVIGGEFMLPGAKRPDEADVGYIISTLTPRYKTMQDLQAARERLVPPGIFGQRLFDVSREHAALSEALGGRGKADDHFGHAILDAIEARRAAEPGQRGLPFFSRIRSHYPEISPEQEKRVGRHITSLAEMPAKYFEAKPGRAVSLSDEFVGAAIPASRASELGPLLERAGIRRIEQYDPVRSNMGTTIMERFPEAGFASGGVVPRADDDDFFRRMALWTYAVAPLFAGPRDVRRHGFAGGGKIIEQAIKAAKLITSEGKPTVRGMVNEAPLFPDVYKNPRLLAEEAESRVAPEDPLLKRLWGVTREDMFNIAGSRPGNREPVLAAGSANPRGVNYAAEGVMVPENAGRLQSILEEGRKQPGLRTGMMPWYYMDPVHARLEQMFDPDEARNRYNLLNTSIAMMSPASSVPTEINRGLGAYHLALQGRFEDFIRGGGKPSEAIGGILPAYMRERMLGHKVHSTSQAGPWERYMRTGVVDMGSPKVTLYAQSSGVPATGFQTRLPVPDAHYTRILGMPDVRRTADPAVSMKMNEYRPVGPWFREEVARPLEMEAVPAQALLWGTGSGATGVDSPIGAPKLEMLSQHIGNVARHYRVSPETARDLILQGTLYSSGGSVINRALDVVSNLPRHQVEPGTPG